MCTGVFRPIRMLRVLRSVLLCLTFLALSAGAAGSLEASARPGDSRLQAEIGDMSLEVFTYRPLNCARPSVLLVFHGNGRGASSYRNSARPVADKACFVVYSPLFDDKRFPNWSYHRGGLVRDGKLLDDDDWTVAVVAEIIEWIRKREGSETPIFLFGHSAGAQFLSRVAAYASPVGVGRIVLANASTYVVPSAEWSVPYGFGGLNEDLFGETAIRAYLAAPVTIYLGLDDTGGKDLTHNADADKQGGTRLERGRFVYEFAREISERNGWPFHWKLVEAPGVGHTARGMLAAGELIEALGFGPQMVH